MDATHSPMFHQIEGLVVDEGITMADLKGALIEHYASRSSTVRTPPCGSGPTTSPLPSPAAKWTCSATSAMAPGKLTARSARTCQGEGWIELLGAGMVHPTVLENCGIDPEKYSGFAFGMGLERMAMGRLKINDLRLIFDNDVRFLNQF